MLEVGQASFTKCIFHMVGFPKWLSQMYISFLCLSKFRWEMSQESIRVKNCMLISCSFSNSRRGLGKEWGSLPRQTFFFASILTFAYYRGNYLLCLKQCLSIGIQKSGCSGLNWKIKAWAVICSVNIIPSVTQAFYFILFPFCCLLPCFRLSLYCNSCINAWCYFFICTMEQDIQ